MRSPVSVFKHFPHSRLCPGTTRRNSRQLVRHAGDGSFRSAVCRAQAAPTGLVPFWPFPSGTYFVFASSLVVMVRSHLLVAITLSGLPHVRQKPGAASHRKIGGDLQREPRLHIDARSAREWQGARTCPMGIALEKAGNATAASMKQGPATRPNRDEAGFA